MPPKHKNIPEEQLSAIVNAAINDTSVEDDEIEAFHDAALAVLMGKVNAKTASTHHKVDLLQLETLISMANKKIATATEQEKHPNVEEAKSPATETNDNSAVATIAEQHVVAAANAADERVQRQKSAKKKGGKEAKAALAMKNDENAKPPPSPQKRQPKARRSGEDILLEDARENVFKGKHPNDVDSEALALALQAGVGQQHHGKGTSSKAAAAKHPTGLDAEDKEHADEDAASVDVYSYQEESDADDDDDNFQPTTTTAAKSANNKKRNTALARRPNNSKSSPNKARVVRAQKSAVVVKSTKAAKRDGLLLPASPVVSASSTTTTTARPSRRTRPPRQFDDDSSSASSMALVLYGQSTPKASEGSTSLAVAIIPTKTPPAKTPLMNGGEHPQQHGSGYRRMMIAWNPRWKQFAIVTEGVVDEVLMQMHARNADEQKKKAGMKAGILDVLFIQITVVQAAKDRGVGLSTIRRYSNAVKNRLHELFGDKDGKDDKLLDAFRPGMTLEEFRGAMQKSGKQIPVVAVAPEKKSPKKRSAPKTPEEPPPAGSSSKPAAKKRKTADEVLPSPRISAPKEEKKERGWANANPKEAATSSSSSSAVKSKDEFNSLLNDSRIVSLKSPHHRSLLTSQRQEREPLSGNVADVQEKVHQYFMGKYKGDSKHLAKMLTNLLHAEYKFRKVTDGMPYELLQSAYVLLARKYQVETMEFFD